MDSVAKISAAPAVQRKCRHKGLDDKIMQWTITACAWQRVKDQTYIKWHDWSLPKYIRVVALPLKLLLADHLVTSTRLQKASLLVFLRFSHYPAIRHYHHSSLPRHHQEPRSEGITLSQWQWLFLVAPFPSKWKDRAKVLAGAPSSLSDIPLSLACHTFQVLLEMLHWDYLV